MSDTRRIQGSVKVDNGSPEDTALKLMVHIGNHETSLKQDRKYWLTLYRQCIMSTHGEMLKNVLQVGNEVT